MKLVETLVVRDEADIVDAQIAYHLNAGVDFVIATDHESKDGTTEILESYAREGCLHLIRERGEVQESAWRTRMARLAATEFGADWVIDSRAYEFWWPRAESLKDLLVAIPARYTTVQALVRHFVLRPGQEFFAERMTVRHAVRRAGDEAKEPFELALRPVFRADPRIEVGPRGVTGASRSVPLRAWYPVEVFSFPIRGVEQAGHAGVPDDEEFARGLADGALVVDTRLCDALQTVRSAAQKDRAVSREFALPKDGVSPLELRPPDVVDDAAYAVECAELGEVDIGSLERHVDQLERRIAQLEARFWPRVRRRLARVFGRLRGAAR